MKFKAVLFDLDGTLLNTLEDVADSMNLALKKLGFPPRRYAEYKMFIGDGVNDLAERVLPDGYKTQELIEKSVILMREEYQRCWTNKTRPYAGIPELLSELTNRGIRMVVLSNKPDPATKKIISILLNQWHFEIVIGSSDPSFRKPDIRNAIKIAKDMELSPEKIIFLGDTSVDMQTAVSAGMYPVGALWGFRTVEELLAYGAKELIAHPLDLLKIMQ